MCLNLILGCLASIQAPIIMMSQNREAQKDRLHSENEYLINLKLKYGDPQIKRINNKRAGPIERA